MDIEPDTKDWTWVLQRPCVECGLDTSLLRPSDVAAMIRDNAAAWPEILAETDARVRPASNVWSATEYACHVRDVFRVFDERLALMLAADNPPFPNWDQDATAVAEHYSEQLPLVVAAELVQAGATLAARFDAVVGPQWQRTGVRSDGAVFTVETFARYLIHDLVHHVYDVTSQPVSR